MPRDAEAWLAERGVRRDPIRLVPEPPAEVASDAPDGPSSPRAAAAPEGAAGASDASDGPDLSVRDAVRLAQQASADAALRQADADATPDASTRRLEDDVVEAVAFVRRSTAAAPQSEGRVRDKLAERGWSAAVVEQALERARRERLVDDAAMAASLVEERQRKGHAPGRIRQDLRARGFDDATLDVALRSAEEQDLEAAAFAVALDKATRCGGLTAEAAFRRVAGHVARRGYPDGLARKVAREALFTARDDERTAGH